MQESMSAGLRVLLAIYNTRVLNGGVELDMGKLGLPIAVISDPYSENNLIVKGVPAGLFIYSVGPDGKDDGGSLDDMCVGLGPHWAKRVREFGRLMTPHPRTPICGAQRTDLGPNATDRQNAAWRCRAAQPQNIEPQKQQSDSGSR